MGWQKNTVQGNKLSWKAESALGTPTGSAYDFRPEPGYTLPTSDLQTYIPESGGHTNPADSNKPIPFKSGEGTGSIDMVVRRATGTDSATTMPTTVMMMIAAGWSNAKITAQGVTTAACAVDSLVTTADVGQEDGMMVAVETTADVFEPMHIAAWTVGTKTAVPVFDMSAAPGDAEIVELMYTLSPRSGMLGATDALTLIELSRAEDGASNPQEWEHGGCGFVLKEITITPNEPVKFLFDILIANTDKADGTWSVETDHEVAGVMMTNNDFDFLLKQGDASAGGLDRDALSIKSITIATGVSLERQASVGGDADVNTVGGYAVKIDPAGAKWTVNGWFDADKWDDYKTEFAGGAGTNPDTALCASWTSQDYLLYPCGMISSPKCNLCEAPTATLQGTDSGMVEGVLVYRATGAGLNSGDGPTSAADQNIWIGIGGSAAP